MENGAEMDDSILIELECPVCTNFLIPPIRQCASGHSICSACFMKLKKCALCLRDFTGSRNFTLEALALKVKYPCQNLRNGCQERLTYAERENHHRNCTKGFKISCAMKGCSFKGDPIDIKAHWLSKRTIFQQNQKDYINLVNGYYKVDLMEAFKESFWFKRSCNDGMIYLAMQYIGNPEKAKNFYYEVEFCDSNINVNKLNISHVCSSIELPDDMLFSHSYYSSVVGFDSVYAYVIDGHSDEQLVYTLRIFQIGDVAKPNLRKKNQKNGSDVKDINNKKGSQSVMKTNQDFEKPNKNNEHKNNLIDL